MQSKMYTTKLGTFFLDKNKITSPLTQRRNATIVMEVTWWAILRIRSAQISLQPYHAKKAESRKLPSVNVKNILHIVTKISPIPVLSTATWLRVRVLQLGVLITH